MNNLSPNHNKMINSHLNSSFLLKSWSLYLILIFCTISISNATRIVNFGDNLPDLVEQRTDKNFIIKFYAPWCYSCQRLEPVYHKFAEKIYHEHDHLIVGRVDCTKYGKVCEAYNVQAYPTITFVNKHMKINYEGQRSVESMTEFAERLNGPDVGQLNNCDLEPILNKHNQFVLSTYQDETNELHRTFIEIARVLKAQFWFYHIDRACKDNLHKDNLYVVKRHMKKPIQFTPISSVENLNLSKQIENWLENESFPVYAQIHRYNYDKALGSGKTLVINILEKYEPARKFTKESAKFHKDFELIIKKLVHEFPDFQYTWTTDLDLIKWLIIGQVAHPNVMILRPDKTYHLFRNQPKDGLIVDEAPFELDDKSIIQFLGKVQDNLVEFQGGNSYWIEILRFIYKYYILFTQMFQSNPLLSSLLVVLPTVVLSLVIYLTCFHEAQYLNNNDEDWLQDEEDGEIIPNERQPLINHVKQD